MKTRKTKTHYGTATIIGTNVANQATNVERIARNESFQACKSSPFDSPVCVTIISFRSRLADADGISAKAAIDGLVLCRVLRGDTTKEISSVTYEQIKVKNKSEEKTIIRIERTC